MNKLIYLKTKQLFQSKLFLQTCLFVLFILSSNNLAFSQTGKGPKCPTGVCIGPGGSKSTSVTITTDTYFDAITIKNNNTLIVKAPNTLFIGMEGTAPGTQTVDFQ